jgi:hypothetical protein
MASQVTLNLSALFAPALNSSGQAVGLQLGYPPTQISIPLAQQQYRSQAYNLVNINDTQIIDFGAGSASSILTTAQFVMLWSSSVFVIGNPNFNGGSGGAIYGKFFMFGFGLAGHQLLNQPFFVQCLSANQVINTMIGG